MNSFALAVALWGFRVAHHLPLKLVNWAEFGHRGQVPGPKRTSVLENIKREKLTAVASWLLNSLIFSLVALTLSVSSVPFVWIVLFMLLMATSSSSGHTRLRRII